MLSFKLCKRFRSLARSLIKWDSQWFRAWTELNFSIYSDKAKLKNPEAWGSAMDTNNLRSWIKFPFSERNKYRAVSLWLCGPEIFYRCYSSFALVVRCLYFIHSFRYFEGLTSDACPWHFSNRTERPYISCAWDQFVSHTDQILLVISTCIESV